MNNTSIELYTFIKYDNFINNEVSETFPDTVDFTLSNIYKNIEPFNFIINMSKYVNINIQLLDKLVGETSYRVKLSNVPVIRASYINDINLIYYINNKIKTYIKYLEDVITRLNNYDIELKFFNTYGRSKNFTINLGEEDLDNNNISLKFKVKLKRYNELSLEDTKYQIQEFIIKYIDNINNEEKNNIYISNLMRELEINLNNIEFIKFEGINNYDTQTQSIESKNIDIGTIGYDAFKTFVPEYLNINYLYDKSTNKYYPDIDIDFI